MCKIKLKLRNFTFIFLIALFYSSIYGCQYFIEIVVKDNTSLTPTFELVETQPYFFDRNPNVREVTIYKSIDGEFDYSKPIWWVTSDGVKLNKILYGAIPDGFELKVVPQKMEYSHKYRISVVGWGSTGFLDFEIKPSHT